MKEIKVGEIYSREDLIELGFLLEKTIGQYEKYNYENGKRRAIFELKKGKLELKMWYLSNFEKSLEKDILKIHKDLI